MKAAFLLITMMLTLGLEAKTLKVMNYNAENFFDTKHDQGTDDYTYISLQEKRSIPGHAEICQKLGSANYVNECLNLDWNEARFTKKLINVARMIRSYDSTGNGPDVVVLEEIENVNVLNKLATKGLDKLGFNYQVLIEGDDARGIDVGLISKYPVITARRYPIFVNGQKLDTRGILEVELDVDGHTVVVYANHWPSQSNPVQERIAAAQLLNKLAGAKRADLVIATGDFNTVKTDRPYPLNYLTDFIDSEVEARKVYPNLNPGTHFYKGEWTSLDRIFIHKSSSLVPDFRKFQIMMRDFAMKKDSRTGVMVPWRFDHNSATGFSDHLPLGLEFNI